MRSQPIQILNVTIAILAGAFMLATGMIAPGTAHSQPPVFTVDLEQSRSTALVVPVNKSRVIQLQTPVRKISVGNPDVADILTLRSRQLYVLGKQLGSTNVLLWDASDQLIAAINIEVSHDLDGLKGHMGRLIAEENIDVASAQGKLILSGQASSPGRMDMALRLATSYAGDDNVINLMSAGGPQQVMLEVKVAEVSRTLGKSLGIDFDAISNRSTRWSFGAVNGGALVDPGIDLVSADPLRINDEGLFANFMSGQFSLNSVINAANENGFAKILAEPTLTTLSGQNAEFLSGGEFPIPVPRGEEGITIEFKEFGVGVNFIPLVLDSGRINLNLNVAVTDLVTSNAVTVSGSSGTFFVPALSKRSASSTVELADGQSIAIAGLINDSTRESVRKFPGLGDIPVLGNLFRSKEFLRGETELLIVVTPHLARPVGYESLELPNSGGRTPTDGEFYLGNRPYGSARTSSSATAAAVSESADADEMLDGRFGHVVNE